MTATHYALMIGKQVLVRIEAFRVLCEIADAKFVYGNTRYLVRPVHGDGEAWVDSSRVEPIES